MAEIQPAVAPIALSAATTHVDHRSPIHDTFCRCTRCKPSGRVVILRGQSEAPRQPTSRVLVAAVIALCLFGAYVATEIARSVFA